MRAIPDKVPSGQEKIADYCKSDVINTYRLWLCFYRVKFILRTQGYTNSTIPTWASRPLCTATNSQICVIDHRGWDRCSLLSARGTP
jgi:hypothetical protein